VIRIVVDVSLSPSWIPAFEKHDIHAVHWSAIGDVRAADRVVLAWARENGHVVFTHDLDYGALLAGTNESGPSVIQVRTHDVLPEHLESILIAAIRQYEQQLEIGAIVTVDETRGKVRLLTLVRARLSE
jgi:predicted nuclease of predicted toxin-antitoxin system